MVAKGSRDRRSTSSTTTTNPSNKRRTSSSTTHEKKKIVKPMGVCSFCLGDEDKNAKGIPEDMISCAECGNCGHPSCLKYSEKLVKKIKTLRWQCLDCKKCIICNKGDDSLLFCDYCDAAIHPKCCDPPLNHIPKGDFACSNCRNDGTIKSTSTRTSTTRSLRSKNSNEEEPTTTTTPTVITRPVAQLIDGMSNFFLPKKEKMNNNNNIQRQQSVQKAMKYLRNKTIKPSNNKVLKRLNTIPSTKSKTVEDQLLARSILSSSKKSRIRRKPINLTDNSPSNSQMNTSTTTTTTRRSTTKKSLTSEPITPTSRVIRRSTTHPVEESTKTNSSRSITKRKHSISSIPQTPVTIKKRTKQDSPVKKTPSKRKEKEVEAEAEEEEQESEDEDNKKIPTVTKRTLNLDLSKYKTPPAFLSDLLPDTIVANDVYLFLDARKNSTKLISDCSEKFQYTPETVEDDINNTRWPPYIVFGDELIKTWYSSSYPQEYARVPRLYICEFCLKYMKCEQVYDRHRKKCQTFHPPANEIYHKDDLSVFEVDGNINRIYCQNLCLLAKLFLDHKTLYYDVEPFLFYVLTKNDSNGCHFLGYFSKEKHCPQKYNLSCITVLPNCQRRGYGRFLIELSYLLSQKEHQIGTPERPLSLHGGHTYEAYWKVKVVQQLLDYYEKKQDICILYKLMNETGMAADDILDTLQNLEVLTMHSNEKPVIHVDITQMKLIMKTEQSKHAHWVSLDTEYLRFTPVLKPILLLNDENSYENQLKKIEVIFKKIESDIPESGGNAADLDDEGNTIEIVRYVRRRKFGRKRRAIYVKCRVTNKNESITPTIHDEHSQEYISRRRDSLANESAKEEEEVEAAEEEETDVNDNDDSKKEKSSPPPPSPPKSPSKQPSFKQLTMDQFLKKLPSNSSVIENSKPEKIFEISPENNRNEETNSDVKTDNNEEFRLPRRTKRLSNSTHVSKSETDLVKMANGITVENLKKPIPCNQDFLLRQISDGTISSNDSSPAPINSPLPFKKRAWTSSNVQALIDPPTPAKKNDDSILSRETSLTTPSSLSDILANPLMASSSSLNSTDEETKIARIESQLKTTVEAVKETNVADDQPPSLTSPTSMIVSQSNHYNYSTRSNVAKQQQQQQQQQQSITINNFTNSTNMTYNFGQTSYPYPYPTTPSVDMQPFYYHPSGIPMNYMPYYPTPPSPMYPSGQQMCYPPNGVNSIPYTGNSTTPYSYSTPQSSSNRRH
ncbi:unnamed protein product [Adineta steineri]|uniref:histone acetyltransferase n=1 Tax=Adineta steineri TaxID=433720 RepID=A0A818VUD4_9BILA|nr:unnamed protein product [Adineta steineri]